jgi:hypothetical protein
MVKVLRYTITTFLFVTSFVTSYSQTLAPKEMSSLELHIHALAKQVLENGQTVDKLTEGDLNTLPLGIARQIGSATYVIIVDSAKYDNRNKIWLLSAYASITLPGTQRPIAFAAKNIAFNPAGVSTTNLSKLVLVSSQTIDVSEHVWLELPDDGHNYVSFNCQGFSGISLKGDFFFQDDFLIPDEKKAPNQNFVKASFETNASSPHDLLMSISITPFRLAKLDNLAFEVKQASADFSDFVNPQGFIFPQSYQNMFGDNINFWRGFYLQELNIRWDDIDNLSRKPITLTAKNLIIDDMGVSGSFSASNLITIDDGSADGWPLSVEQLSVTLQMNRLSAGTLTGKMKIPMLGDEPVDYEALVEHVEEDLNYRFSVATSENKEFQTPLAAKIKLNKGSIISVEKRQGKILASAILSGDLTLDHSIINLKGIKFESVHLTTQKPYVQSGLFSTVGSGEGRCSGFPIQLDSINFKIYNGQVAIGCQVALNFMNKEDRGFSASTQVLVLAKYEEKIEAASEASKPSVKSQHWKFDKVKINDIAINISTMAFSLKGRLSVFQDDPTYGNGFRGSLAFSLKSLLKDVRVNAYFGSKPTYRYWHLDLYVPVNFYIYPPVVAVDGIMGGASYHMVRQQPFVPNFKQLAEKRPSSPLESIYLPDEKAGLALLAGVSLIIGTKSIVNADAQLEVAFNQGGGLRYIQFDGHAYFFTSPTKREIPEGNQRVDAAVYAGLHMVFDNENHVFHANLDTYMNVAGIIKGIGPNNLVGEAVIHVDKKDWYVYIGRPSQMFGVNILGLAQAKTYFMVGTQIENIPPPPPEVREVFDDIDPGTMRDETALHGGRGFALGAHLKIGFDSKRKLQPFYVVVMVGAGADIMLRDYGEAYCVGRSEPIGIDGWYASGQAYVFLKGKVGIRVKRKEFDFLSLGAAALLQAKLPNPTWMKGRLGGHFKILGGLVKGKFNLTIQIGDECEIVAPGSELENIEVIADLKPDASAADVSVFTATQVSFNTSLDTEFKMMDFKDELKSYRIKLDEFTITKDGIPLEASMRWNEKKDVAVLKTRNILPPNSSLTVRAKIHWEKRNVKGGWESVTDGDGVIVETKEATFSTGSAPKFIPDENVVYCYPIKHQSNLHIRQSNQGYVKLDFGQDYLFESSSSDTTWQYIARFQQGSSPPAEEEIQYSPAESMIRFMLPQSLKTESVYKLTFVKRPRHGNGVDQNLNRTEQNVSNQNDETVVSTNTNNLQGTIQQDVETSIYTSAFRTSIFETFEQKWNSLQTQLDLYDVATGYVAVIGRRFTTAEMFDEFELKNTDRVKSLIKAQAGPSDWMNKTIAPMLYDYYPAAPGLTIQWRDTLDIGVKPLRGIRLFNNNNLFPMLSEQSISSGIAPSQQTSFYIGYFLSYYSFWDYDELSRAASVKYLDQWNSTPASVRTLLSANAYTDLTKGTYPITITYSLPGQSTPVFRRSINLNFD